MNLQANAFMVPNVSTYSFVILWKSLPIYLPGAGIEVEAYEGALEVGAGEPMFLVGAVEGLPASLLPTTSSSGRFQHRLQQEREPRTIPTTRLALEKT